MDAVHEEIYKGYTIKIVPDENPESPREWDNMSLMICFHRDYVLGDKHEYKSENYENWKEMQKAIVKETKAIAWLPLFLYDHSGITMYTTGDTAYHQHEAWDSSMVGFIVMPKSENTKGMTKARAEKILRDDIKTYDQYLTGDVYGYVVEKDGEDIDSVWGFYGTEDAIEEAKSVVDYHAKEAQQKHEARLKAQIKKSVPLQYRIV